MQDKDPNFEHYDTTNQMRLKKTFAQEVLGAFNVFPGEKVLDIGTRTGENAYALSQSGADVYSVEPDRSALEYAVKKGYVDKDKAFPITLQDLPPEHQGTFDKVSVFFMEYKSCRKRGVRRSFNQGS